MGRLTLLTPNTSMILNITKIHGRPKRSVIHFQEDCRNNLDFWEADKVIAASILAPGVAVSHALTTLNKLGCWFAKQNNATSAALSALLADTDSIMHATLQNRAAIDFLLLAQGHGCEEFEGMCFMNLSDNSQMVFLKKMNELSDKLTTSSLELQAWLKGLGITGWLMGLVKGVLILLIAFVAVIVVVPCLLQCLQKMINHSIRTIWLVETKKGGIMGDPFGDKLELIDTAVH